MEPRGRVEYLQAGKSQRQAMTHSILKAQPPQESTVTTKRSQQAEEMQ